MFFVTLVLINSSFFKYYIFSSISEQALPLFSYFIPIAIRPLLLFFFKTLSLSPHHQPSKPAHFVFSMASPFTYLPKSILLTVFHVSLSINPGIWSVIKFCQFYPMDISQSFLKSLNGFPLFSN